MSKLFAAITTGCIGFFITFCIYTLYSEPIKEAITVPIETKWTKIDSLPQEYGLHYIPYKDDSNNGYLICAKDSAGISITFVAVKWN